MSTIARRIKTGTSPRLQVNISPRSPRSSRFPRMFSHPPRFCQDACIQFAPSVEWRKCLYAAVPASAVPNLGGLWGPREMQRGTNTAEPNRASLVCPFPIDSIPHDYCCSLRRCHISNRRLCISTGKLRDMGVQLLIFMLFLRGDLASIYSCTKESRANSS